MLLRFKTITPCSIETGSAKKSVPIFLISRLQVLKGCTEESLESLAEQAPFSQPVFTGEMLSSLSIIWFTPTGSCPSWAVLNVSCPLQLLQSCYTTERCSWTITSARNSFPVLPVLLHMTWLWTIHGHQVHFELSLSVGTLGFGWLVFKPLRLLLANFSPNCSAQIDVFQRHVHALGCVH